MGKLQFAAPLGGVLPSPTAARKMLDLTYVAQQKKNWCWAACFAMVRQCLGLTPMDQCVMAMTQRDGIDCDDPNLDRMMLALEAAPGCGLRCDQFPLPGGRGTLPLADIVKEIDQKRPVGIQLGDIVTGHVVLAVGYGPGGRLEIFDPDRTVGHTSASYATLATAGYQGKSWEASFYNFAARPADFDA